jgi:uncharacterized membrane protein YdbT with pleckstrin-like domain
MQPEKVIGVWKHSKLSGGFWWRTLLTVGLYAVVEARQQHITLTTERVTQHRGGLLSSSEISISLSKIANVSVRMSWLGRLLGYGDIAIESEGSGGPQIQFRGLARPGQLRDAIYNSQQGGNAAVVATNSI